jgi:hypothetical protein
MGRGEDYQVWGEIEFFKMGYVVVYARKIGI